MIPNQHPSQNGRQQPSALFSQQGSFLTNRSTPPTLPGPAAPDPKNDAFRADIRPEFMNRERPSLASPAGTPNSVMPRTISEQYNQARRQLTSFEPIKGYATEKQRRDFAWEARNDPLGVRDAARKFEQTYQRFRENPQTPPNRPTNFNGPGPRFTA